MLKPFTAMYLHLLCIFNVILSLVLLVSAQQSRVGYQPGEVGLKKKHKFIQPTILLPEWEPLTLQQPISYICICMWCFLFLS